MSLNLSYKQIMDNCQQFNRRIGDERRCRQPFVDAQTGVAQHAGELYRNRRQRHEMNEERCLLKCDAFNATVIKYPARRWRKRPQSNSQLWQNFVTFNQQKMAEPSDNVKDEQAILESVATDVYEGKWADDSPYQDDTTSWLTSAAGGDDASNFMLINDDAASSLAAGDSDDVDYCENERTARRQRKQGTNKKKLKHTNVGRPSRGNECYQCHLCSAKYKTKPGLAYHLSHVHHQQSSSITSLSLDNNIIVANDAPIVPSVVPSGVSASVPVVGPTTSATGAGPPVPSQFCDFCLGDVTMNKKTQRAEQLVACKDCGRAGHPTCLQFTPNMVESTQRHGWQCIDCKSCAVCGTSENDDQLLFCDDCDRGFHMYCLKPKLSKAPEGCWSCYMCILEFGPSASNPRSSQVVE